MSYYTAFKIEETTQIQIPSDFLNHFQPQKENTSRKKYLETLSDDIMTVKEYNELQTIIKKEKEIIINLKGNFKITNNYDIFSKTDFDTRLFYYNIEEDTITLNIGDGEVLELYLDEDFFVGDGELYSKSNHSWVEEIIIELIELYSVSCTIEDLGDEEYGFVYEEGCERELKSAKVYMNGVLQK